MSPFQLALIAVFAPLAAAFALLVFAPLRRAGAPAAALSVAGALASLGASVALLAGRMGGADAEFVWSWLPEAGQTAATIGLRLDGVSLPMLVVVAFVASCVQVFSLAYMAEETDADYGRYFTWHALFLFSMQALVVAPNLLQLFAAWELVGLCSYLLIGFYYQRSSAGHAALKAFWVTKLADLGLLFGLIAQYSAVGSFGWDPATVTALQAAGLPAFVAGLYFIAVMGKSAQFPLHVWLPDAMEGPTPVSALLHAATMVAAGVFLIVRAWPIFEAAPTVLLAMSMIGGFTALFAALIALTQTDIKRVLAYSTCSQLGYMVAALGAGGLFAGYFHLVTHAFFKALLFLAAGSVIHAVHSNELAKMGGLWRRMRLTTAVFVLGAAALAGLPGLSGFFSKDQILERLLEATHHQPLYWAPLAACLLTVGLTALYMSRVVFQAFFGAPSEAAAHAHEGGARMTGPLLALAVPSVFAGLFGGPLLALLDVPDAHFHLLAVTPIGLAALALAGVGIGLGYLTTLGGQGQAAQGALAPLAGLVAFGAVDRAWRAAYDLGLLSLGAAFAWVDRYLVDGLLNAVGAGALLAGEAVRDLQTGRVSTYLYAVAMGVICVAAWSQLAALLGGAS